MNENCSTCMYGRENAHSLDERDDTLLCFLHPPVLVQMGSGLEIWKRPPVNPEDTCASWAQFRE